MLIDVHTHLMGPQYKQQRPLLLKAMERYGLSKIFVSGLCAVPNPTAEMLRLYNDEVYDFKKENPDRVEAYAYVSPELPGAIEEMRYGIEDHGAVGVKIWMSTLCDDHAVDKVAEKLIDYGMPILIHAFHKAVGQLPNETLGNHVANLARRYPELKIIMAHFGGNAYHGIPPIRSCKNVWVDSSDSIFRGDELQYVIEQIGAERILFGSDMPGNFIVNLGQVYELSLSAEQRDAILYKNALRVFDTSFRLGRGN